MKSIALCAIVAGLGGCAAPTGPNGAAFMPSRTGSASRPHHSWMDAKAKNVDLLYISDANGEVTVYTYFQKTLVGELTDFTKPMGECVNEQGDVYITDSAAKRIVEYAHAGTKPIRAINDSPYTPNGCSVDLATGTLAVANETGGKDGRGSVTVYVGGSGKPLIYDDPQIKNFVDCAYDGSSNLLANGGTAGTDVASFAILAKGERTLFNVRLPAPSPSMSLEEIAGVQWDGKYFVLDYYGLYRESFINGQFFYVGSTDLYVDSDATPYWIFSSNPKKQGTQVVGATGEGIEYWNYPQGGEDTGYIYKALDNPYGVTVSLAH